MERRRNGVNKGFANDYERLYKAGISNPDHETQRRQIKQKMAYAQEHPVFLAEIDTSICAMIYTGKGILGDKEPCFAL